MDKGRPIQEDVVMLCESCHQRDALVHLSRTVSRVEAKTVAGELIDERKEPQLELSREFHFCQQCADAFFACTPGLNASRHLICLSDSYRSSLYDALEKVYPQAFDNSTTEACVRGSEFMATFLREQLKNDGIEVNEDAFGMLLRDFFGSHHFYSRGEDYMKRK